MPNMSTINDASVCILSGIENMCHSLSNPNHNIRHYLISIQISIFHFTTQTLHTVVYLLGHMLLIQPSNVGSCDWPAPNWMRTRLFPVFLHQLGKDAGHLVQLVACLHSDFHLYFPAGEKKKLHQKTAANALIANYCKILCKRKPVGFFSSCKIKKNKINYIIYKYNYISFLYKKRNWLTFWLPFIAQLINISMQFRYLEPCHGQ